MNVMIDEYYRNMTDGVIDFRFLVFICIIYFVKCFLHKSAPTYYLLLWIMDVIECRRWIWMSLMEVMDKCYGPWISQMGVINGCRGWVINPIDGCRGYQCFSSFNSAGFINCMFHFNTFMSRYKI